jgi:hypothetical protein
MRRGIRWTPSHPPGVDRVPEGMCYEGYPVHFDKDCGLAQAKGIWPFKSIAVGPLWFTLTGAEQQACLLHEVGHNRRFHLEKRLLVLPFFWIGFIQRMAARQEMEADAFAAREGYGLHFLKVISRHHQTDGEFYPSFGERIQNLYRLINEAKHEMAA